MASILDSLLAVNHTPEEKICLLHHKDADTDEAWGEFQAYRDQLEQLYRCDNVKTIPLGQIIGSNEGRDAAYVGIMTSLFTSIPDCVLRTCLRTGKPVPWDAIWKQVQRKSAKYPNRLPQLDRGFRDPDLNETFLRIYIDRLVQFMMRGRARNYDGKRTDVVCWMPNRWAIEELKRMLPGIQVHGDEFIEGLERMTRDQIAELSNSDIRKLAHCSKRDERKYRRIAARYYFGKDD